MSDINLEALGFTKEDIQERVIERICSRVMSGTGCDEDGEEYATNSAFARKLEARVSEQVDAAINAVFEKHIAPNVHKYVEDLTLQETNRWGEKTGKKMTFIEYLIERANAYIVEEVNFEGKSKAQANGYSWSPAQTRITHLVHQHLHYSISNAMKSALETANSQIVKGIQETVKLKLASFAADLKVAVEMKERR